jgi:hypothetical protein
LERYWIRGNIHILTYEGFDSVRSYGSEIGSSNRNHENRQRRYTVTLESGEQHEIYGSIIYENCIASVEDLFDNFQRGSSCRIVICREDTTLLDRFIKKRDGISEEVVDNIERAAQLWRKLLRNLAVTQSEEEYEKLYKRCKGYTRKFDTFKSYFDENYNAKFPKRNDLEAILAILNTDEEKKTTIRQAGRLHQYRTLAGKDMKEEILNYRLTGNRYYIDDEYNHLLEDWVVTDIKLNEEKKRKTTE